MRERAWRRARRSGGGDSTAAQGGGAWLAALRRCELLTEENLVRRRIWYTPHVCGNLGVYPFSSLQQLQSCSEWGVYLK